MHHGVFLQPDLHASICIFLRLLNTDQSASLPCCLMHSNFLEWCHLRAHSSMARVRLPCAAACQRIVAAWTVESTYVAKATCYKLECIKHQL